MTAAATFQTMDPAARGASAEGYASLVLRAKGGDQAALAVLYESFFDRVYRYVLVRVNDAAEAEDITEEVFLRMLRSLGGFRPQDGTSLGFSSWLFRIAHNLVVDRIRRSSCREASLAFLRASCEAEDDAWVDTHHLDRDELNFAIDCLSGAQREVIILRFASGLSLAETAAALGKQVANVKVLQHNALANLRRLLEASQRYDAAPALSLSAPPA